MAYLSFDVFQQILLTLQETRMVEFDLVVFYFQAGVFDVRYLAKTV